MYESIISERGKRRVFEGELVPQMQHGEAVNHFKVRGFRLESESIVTVTGNKVIESTRRPPDARGVYIAKVIVKGVKSNKHNFFPRDWTAEQVLQSIAEAYVTREPHAGGEAGSFAVGRSSSGMRVLMELDDDGLVLDASPFKRPTNPRRAARWMIEQGRIKKSKHICVRCQCPKVPVCLNGHNLPVELRRHSLIVRIVGYVRWMLRKVIRVSEGRDHAETTC